LVQDLGFFIAEKRKIVVECGKIEMHFKNFKFFVVAFESSWLGGSLELYKEYPTLFTVAFSVLMFAFNLFLILLFVLILLITFCCETHIRNLNIVPVQ
jgi:hypothetical protein